MTKTIKLCDICGKQFNSEEKYKGGVEDVDVKAKIDGQRFDMSFEECHGKLVNTTIDMCDDCYSKYKDSVKLIVSRDENGQYTHYRIEDFVETPIGFEEDTIKINDIDMNNIIFIKMFFKRRILFYCQPVEQLTRITAF